MRRRLAKLTIEACGVGILFIVVIFVLSLFDPAIRQADWTLGPWTVPIEFITVIVCITLYVAFSWRK